MENHLTEIEELKKNANNHYLNGEYELAVTNYFKGLEYLKNTPNELKCTFYINIAACYLKLEKFDDVIQFTCKALDIDNNNQKALYRRCIAYEKIEKIADAFLDIKRLLDLNPKNQLYIDHGKALYIKLNENNTKLNQPSNIFTSLLSKIQNSNSIDTSNESEMNIRAFLSDINNRNIVCTEENINKIIKLSKDAHHQIISIRILSLLCKHSFKNSSIIMKFFNIDLLKQLSTSSNQEIKNAMYLLISEFIENIVKNYCVVNIPPKEDASFLLKTKYRDAYTEYLKSFPNFNNYITLLFQSITRSSPMTCNIQIMNIFNKLLTIDEYISIYLLNVNFPEFMIKFAAYSIDIGAECQSITQDHYTLFNIISSCLNLINHIVQFIPDYVKKLYAQLESQLLSTINNKSSNDLCFFVSLYPILSVSSDISIYFLLESSSKYGEKIICFLENMLQNNFEIVLKRSKYDFSVYLFFAELMISMQSCRKYKTLTSFNELSKKIFLYFYNHTDLKAKLVGLLGLVKYICDIEDPVNPNFLQYLHQAKPLLLNNPTEQSEAKILEILSFLSLNGDVKEDLISDENFMNHLMDLSLNYAKYLKKVSDDTKNIEDIKFLPSLFFICTILANIVNILPPDKMRSSEEEAYCHNKKELKKLAQSIGQPLPKTHPKDKKSFVNKRIKIISNSKFYSVLYNATLSLKCSGFSKSGSSMLSKHCPYYIANLYYITLMNPDNRGVASQAGAIKALLVLARSLKIGTHLPANSLAYLETPYIAAHALSLIGITIDPNLTFHGESINETLRPLLCITDFDQKELRRFEALLALTNFVSLNDSIREHFVNIEGGFQIIKTSLFDDNTMIRRAAVEFTTNMMQCNLFVNKFFTPPPYDTKSEVAEDAKDPRAENIRLLVLLSGELEDDKLCSAASGALALLSYHEIPSRYIIEVKSFFEIIKSLMVCSNINLVYRSMFIINNLIQQNIQLAERIINSDIFEIMLALNIKLEKEKDEISEKTKDLISKSLKKAKTYQLVKDSI